MATEVTATEVPATEVTATEVPATGGPTVMKISKNKGIAFYAKSAEQFLRGVGSKEPVSQIIVSAVGNAIPAAASVADILERKSIATIGKIETLYAEIEKGRFRPQLQITLDGTDPDDAPTPAMPERLEGAKMEKKLKKVKKEGGKRGVEIEGAADMGGLQFFCTSVVEPAGDLDMLVECMKAMNEKSKPDDEERKGGSGKIGKLLVCLDEANSSSTPFNLVCYVPPSKQKDTTAKSWLSSVLKDLGCGEVHKDSTDTYAKCEIEANAEKGIFPMKLRDQAIAMGIRYLRTKSLFPEDKEDDSDDDYVFGDEDFPS